MTIEQLRAELDATPESNWDRRQNLMARWTVARIATDALAEFDPEIAALTNWRDHLVEWRQILCDELLAGSPRSPRGLELSIIRIDRELDFMNEGAPAEMRLDALMREAGYIPADAVARANGGAWFGCLPKVQRRLADLHKRRDQAHADLSNVLRDPVTA